MHPKAFPEALTVSSYLLRGMRPKAFPEALPASNYSVAGSAMQDYRVVLSTGHDKVYRGGGKDSTDVNEKSAL